MPVLVSSQSQCIRVPIFTPTLLFITLCLLLPGQRVPTPCPINVPLHTECFTVPASSSSSLPPQMIFLSHTFLILLTPPNFLSQALSLPDNWLYPITCTHSQFPLTHYFQSLCKCCAVASCCFFKHNLGKLLAPIFPFPNPCTSPGLL